MTALIILDGFGCRTESAYNAIRADGIKRISRFIEDYPHTKIAASGMAVGLPEGQMGNSEVGHLNLGAGRIVYQELTRITKSIEDGDFFENPAFNKAIDTCLEKGTKLHLFGLCSDGGVHSHLNHLYALVKLAKQKGLDRVYIHCFMDGRDVPPQSGKDYIAALQAELIKLGCGRIATIMGRYYAMDRDNRFERVEKAYAAMTYGEGVKASDPVKAMQASYDNGVTDEFVLPIVITENGKPVATVDPDDSVIFFNFRPDRAREISRTFIDKDFNGFERKYFDVHYVCMTQYDKTFENVYVTYKPQTLTNTLGEYLAKNEKRQFRIAETEKYAHVTFFFNGGVEKPNEGEDRFLIPSPKVATYDLKPEMSAYEVADEAVKHIESGEYDVMVLNFANPDMVGHTGVLEAAVKAVTTVDACASKVVQSILKMGGEVLITADHGNSEKMFDENGGPFTAHTTNPVPLILVSDRFKNAKLKSGGRLADIAPTLLHMIGLAKPEEMTGESLIEA